MDSSTVTLLCVIALLIVYVAYLQHRIDTLTLDTLNGAQRRSEDAAEMARKSATFLPEQLAQVLDSVNTAVERQVAAAQTSMKVAWAPNPPPVTPLQDGIEQIMQKYNMPTIMETIEHDLNVDPTDQYLHENVIAHRQDAAMIPESGLDAENPTGIPGFQPAWSQ